MIKAIETHWRGHRFRSRLEARWAVFFDVLGVPWEYEPQGFVLGGTPYLPDFWLPSLGLWVEVKATGRDTREDWELCRRLCVDTGSDVMMVFGHLGPVEMRSPASHRPAGYMLELSDAEAFELAMADLGRTVILGSNRMWEAASDGRPAGHFQDGCCEFAECPLCGELGASLHGQHGRCQCRCGPVKIHHGRRAPANGLRPEEYCAACGCCVTDNWRGARESHETRKRGDSHRLMRAYQAARSARFEHGESP